MTHMTSGNSWYSPLILISFLSWRSKAALLAIAHDAASAFCSSTNW